MNPHASENAGNANANRGHGHQRFVPSRFLSQYISQRRTFGLNLATVEKTLQIFAEGSRRFITTLRLPLKARHDNRFELSRYTFENAPQRRSILVDNLGQ